MKKVMFSFISLLFLFFSISALTGCVSSEVNSESEARRVLLSCVSTLKEVQETLNEMDIDNLDANALKSVADRLNVVYADIKSTDLFYDYAPVKERYDSAEKQYESVLKQYENYMKILEGSED